MYPNPNPELLERAKRLIDLAIKKKVLLTYQEFANTLGYPTWGTRHFVPVLAAIVDEDVKNKKPIRTSIVVKIGDRTKHGEVIPGTRMPSDGYFQYAEEKGLIFQDKVAFWLEQLSRLGISKEAIYAIQR